MPTTPPPGPAPDPQERTRQHLSTVETSTDWADLPEILAWYKADVSALLADLTAVRAQLEQVQADRDYWKQKYNDLYDARD